MPFTLPIWFTPLVQALACAYAISKGDVEERLVAWEYAVVASIDYIFVFQHKWYPGLDMVSGIVDLGVAMSVAMRSSKIWPIAYSAVTLVSLATTMAQNVIAVSGWAYGTAMFVWVYLQCLILVVGAWRAGRVRRDAGLMRLHPRAIRP
jgi:hypothetical protein